ncbi:MAG: hypothetical protein PHV30_06020 [Candidatus Margulisbacteria bacterium]|nr:hypothetical protein [Candidatus Margulisiibacteriota bacterium]
MTMVSYWTEVKEVYSHDTFVVISGKYNHKNKNKDDVVRLGLYWKNEEGIGYPNARGYLAPIVLDEHFIEGFLQFILYQSMKVKNYQAVNNIREVIEKLPKSGTSKNY